MSSRQQEVEIRRAQVFARGVISAILCLRGWVQKASAEQLYEVTKLLSDYEDRYTRGFVAHEDPASVARVIQYSEWNYSWESQRTDGRAERRLVPEAELSVCRDLRGGWYVQFIRHGEVVWRSLTTRLEGRAKRWHRQALCHGIHDCTTPCDECASAG